MLPVREIRETGLAHDVARRGQEGGHLVHRGGLRSHQFGALRLQLLRLPLGRRGLRLGLPEFRLASAYVSVFLDLLLFRPGNQERRGIVYLRRDEIK